MSAPDEDDLALVTVAEAARLAGVSRATVRAWIRERGLRTHRLPSHPVLLSEAQVLEVERDTRRSSRGRPRLQRG